MLALWPTIEDVLATSTFIIMIIRFEHNETDSEETREWQMELAEVDRVFSSLAAAL